MLIAKYMFDPEINADALPTFNSGYEYTVEDMNHSETFDTYNNVLPSYYGYNPQYHSPIILSDGTLSYVESYWDWYSLDVTEYVNKQVTVSFDISCVDDEQSWRPCEGWITGYAYDIAEGVSAGSEPKHISYTSTLLSNTFDIQGASIKLTNIQIMVEGVNLFDTLPGFNSYFISDDYDPTRNDNTACKVNNELWFTYSPWARICYDISTLSKCDITVSFDINKLDVGDDLWIEFIHNVFNTNVGEYIHYENIVGDMYSAITDTIHVETTFTLEPGYKGYYVLEGMNGLVSNFKIEVQSPYKVRSIYSDDDFTSCSFNGITNLLTVEYLKVTSKVTRMDSMFYICSQLAQLDASNWDVSNVTDMSTMFYKCSSLTSLDLANWDIKNVTKTNNMFHLCSQLAQLDVSDWDTSNVKNTASMFNNCIELTQLDVSNWDTENVTNMSYMFYNCSSLTQLDVSNWDTSNVTDMSNMFSNCTQLAQLDVSNWDTSNVTLMNHMFNNCSSLVSLDLSSFNTTKVTTMSNMFYYCKKITTLVLSSFNTSKVTSINHMFRSCPNLTKLDLSNWDTSSVTSMDSVFRDCVSLSQIDLSNWDTGSVTNISYMFYRCSSLTQLDVSNFDTSNVTSMDSMFNGCSKLTHLDVSNWNMNKVKKMTNMFDASTMLTHVTMNNSDYNSVNKIIGALLTITSGYGLLDVTGVDDISLVNEETLNSKRWLLLNIVDNLIAKYTSKTQGLRPTFNRDFAYTVTRERLVNDIYEIELSADTDFSSVTFSGKTDLLTLEYLKVTSKVTKIINTFYSCTALTRLNASNWNTSQVTDMNGMFRYCPKLAQLDASNWDTSKVKNMNSMFNTCQQLTTIGDVSNWNTSNVTDMCNMFQNCYKLTQLDVSNWDTSNVTAMYNICNNCSSLTQLDVSNWDTSNVTDMSNMFNKCSSLTQLDVSNWDTSNVTAMTNMFNDCTQLAQLDVSNFVTSNVTDMQQMFQRCSKLQHIGMLYCDDNTVNTIANALPTVSGLTRTIYIQDTKSNIYTPRDSIVFYDYKGSRTTINLPQPLNNGDMLIWDDSLRRYTLKKSDGSVIEIDTNVKYVLDVVGTYYRIETDEKESAPASMTVKLYISKDVL